MKILALSDEVIDRLYSASVRETYPDVRMLLGCGDLPYPYLEFLVSMFNVPLFYVPGNHDPAYGWQNGRHAEGGFNLDGEVVYSKGLLMAGMGGSIMYHPGAPNQYTQSGMFLRAYRLLLKIFMQRIRFGRNLDLLLTHSPPFGVHDDDDPAHIGLRALNMLLQATRPRYMLHGHTMFYRQNLKSHITQYASTQIVNVYPFRLVDIEP